MKHYLERLIHFVNNRIDTRVLIFVLLSMVYVRFEVDGNTEHYFQMAKQFIDPIWMPNSWVLNEVGDARGIYEYLAGWLLTFITFEQLAFWGTLLMCLLFSFPLGKLYHLVAFSNIDIILHLFSLCFFYPFFIAGEWILIGFEAKQFAYIFVFYSFFYFLKSAYLKSVLLGVLATYMHVLAGGWYMFYLLLYLLIFGVIPFKTKALYATIYALLVLPFAWYLAQKMLLQAPVEGAVVHPDWIYTYYRHPHHTALFVSKAYFMKVHFPGLIKHFLALGTCWVCYSYFKNAYFHTINKFTILSLLGVLLFVLVAWFDSGGHFVKFYPFRISAFSYFLFGLLGIYLLRGISTFFQTHFYLNGIILLVTFYWWASAFMLNLQINKAHFFDGPTAFEQATAFIRNNTPEKAVILYLDKSRDGDNSFIRKSLRDRLVSFKFIPTAGERLVQWYDRNLEKERIVKDLDHLLETQKKYRLDYLLIHKKIERPYLKLLYENEGYFLYIINP